MKQWIKRILIGVVVLAVMSGCFMYFFRETYAVLHIPPVVCQYTPDGITPEVFCATKGADTILNGNYAYAKVDKDGCLILIVEKEIVDEWKNSLLPLQILQCVLGDSRDIGITVDYSYDFLNYMERAESCGFEIAEDFKKIIDGPGDNSWYCPFIFTACIELQMFEGKDCKDIFVELYRYDDNGELLEYDCYPDFLTEK